MPVLTGVLVTLLPAVSKTLFVSRVWCIHLRSLHISCLQSGHWLTGNVRFACDGPLSGQEDYTLQSTPGCSSTRRIGYRVVLDVRATDLLLGRLNKNRPVYRELMNICRIRTMYNKYVMSRMSFPPL